MGNSVFGTTTRIEKSEPPSKTTIDNSNSNATAELKSDTKSKILDYPEVLGNPNSHNAFRHVRGYWMGEDIGKLHSNFIDTAFAQQLSLFLRNEKCSSVIDIGAGDGSYSQAIADGSEIFVSCYDGNPDTQTISGGRCAVLDFSRMLQLPSRYDWVLSLKVGKHIPEEFEDTFFKNMDTLNTKGVIINWGGSPEMTPHTPQGAKYFNHKSDSYIIKKFTSLGYVQDVAAQKFLTNSASNKTLRDRLLVFRKQRDPHNS